MSNSACYLTDFSSHAPWIAFGGGFQAPPVCLKLRTDWAEAVVLFSQRFWSCTNQSIPICTFQNSWNVHGKESLMYAQFRKNSLGSRGLSGWNSDWDKNLIIWQAHEISLRAWGGKMLTQVTELSGVGRTKAKRGVCKHHPSPRWKLFPIGIQVSTDNTTCLGSESLGGRVAESGCQRLPIAGEGDHTSRGW